MPGIESDGDMEGFRAYLKFLALQHIPIDRRGRIDPSDVVQETLFRAIRDRHHFRGRTEAEMAGWLRTILRFRLIDLLRSPGIAAISLEEQLERSSIRLGEWSALNPGSTPSAGIIREETAVRVASILTRLAEDQAEAVMLKHCEGWPVAEISRHMNRTPQEIGGLLKRGMKRLRELLPREG